MKKVIVPVAKGFEENELISVVDVLRRCEIGVEILSLESSPSLVGAHNITLQADGMFAQNEYEECACIALVGGYENMQRMRAHKGLGEVLRAFASSHRLIAAICAAPIVLAHFRILSKEFTCYPSCQAEALRESHADEGLCYVDRRVCYVDSILTSQGPATAMEFALRLADILHTENLGAYQINADFHTPLVQNIASGLLYQA